MAARRRCRRCTSRCSATNSAVLAALTTNSLDWAGNFLTGLQAAFTSGRRTTRCGSQRVQTNSLEPNLKTWPTNQLAVRKAISLAIDRTAISKQGESGLEPVATNASGIVLPNFAADLAPAVEKDTLLAARQPEGGGRRAEGRRLHAQGRLLRVEGQGR